MRRAVLPAAYAAYLVVLGYLVWSPEPTTATSAVSTLTDALHGIGLPVSSSAVGFALNVLLFVPMGLLGVFVFGRRHVPGWVLAGFAASVIVEVVQRLLLPDRTWSASDIVANTLGALVGAGLGWLATRGLGPGRAPYDPAT